MRIQFYLRCQIGTLIMALASLSGAKTMAQDNSSSMTMDEIIVTANQHANKSTEIGRDAAALLNTAGEISDPLKALLVLPSITFAANDFDDPVIRGAGPDDNLFIVDDIPLNNIFHELSDSIIADRVVRTFDVYAASPPVAYSGGVGGVVNISLRDPDDQRRQAALDLGLLKSGAFVEGPLSDNLSAYVSFRENLARVFLTNFENETEFVREKLPTSRDYTARIKWSGDTVDVTATSIGTYDQTKDEQLEGLNFQPGIFDRMDTRQDLVNAVNVKKHLESETSLSVTAAYLTSSIEESRPNVGEQSLDVDTLSVRSRYDGEIGSMDVGVGLNFRSDAADARMNQVTVLPQHRETFRLWDGFITGKLSLSDSLDLNAGVSISHDDVFGDTRLDPRVGAELRLGNSGAAFIRAGTARQRGRIRDLLSLSATERAMLSRNRSKQISGGYRQYFGEDWRAQAEVYYKDIRATEFDLEPNPVSVEGDVYGLDVIVSKSAQSGLYGFLALSISDNTRQLPSTGETFDYEFGAPVSATLAINYAFGNVWNIGGKYRYQTGQVFTPASIENGPSGPELVFGQRFSERSDDYQRLDIRLERALSLFGTDASIYADAINVLNMENLSGETPISIVSYGNGDLLPVGDEQTGVPLVVALGLRMEF